ncbi:MAG: F0F1 ATP synthase subunit gamma, partial [bacterium]|nr:F0F1 ATP synthase subunit gamma [bacterium]
QGIYLDADENIKKIEFIYTEYISASKREIRIKQLFPIKSEWLEDESGTEYGGNIEDTEYIFEPSEQEIFEYLLPKYIDTGVRQILFQSATAEHMARMVAMEQATQNANDMIRALTLTMNKLRQASITKELLEIITATEALRK